MKPTIDVIARDLEATGLLPDPAAIAVAAKGVLFDLPLLAACEAVRFQARIGLAVADHLRRVAAATGAARESVWERPVFLDDAAPTEEARATVADAPTPLRRAA